MLAVTAVFCIEFDIYVLRERFFVLTVAYSPPLFAPLLACPLRKRDPPSPILLAHCLGLDSMVRIRCDLLLECCQSFSAECLFLAMST